jgi:hypothetical protein
MKKLFYFLFLYSGIVNAQSIEIGAYSGFKSSNIVNRRTSESKAVIGKNYWNPNYGIQMAFNFKPNADNLSYRLIAFYDKSTAGSKSTNSNDKFEMESNTYGLTFGTTRQINFNWSAGIGAGFAYGVLDTKNYYRGNLEQYQSFPKTEYDIIPKNNYFDFIIFIDVERNIIPNVLNFVIALNINASVTKINQSQGSYGIQGGGLSAGFRYNFELSKYPKNEPVIYE